MASCNLTPACNPKDHMLTSRPIRRPLSDCSSAIDSWWLADRPMQLSDVWACTVYRSNSSSLTYLSSRT